MNRLVVVVVGIILALSTVSLVVVADDPAPAGVAQPDSPAAFDYLKRLAGRWEVRGGDEGPFGWEFEVT